jgi:hypothetical protein
MAFNLDSYEDVQSRVKRWQLAFPVGRIVTDVIQFDAVKGHILVAASVYREHEDTLPAAVDYAFGDAATYPAQMRKFYVEDTCTSAIGRAISLVLETTTKATKQDMAKVERIKNDERSEAIANAPLAINNTWDEFVGKEPTPEPVTLSAAAEMVQQAFGEAEPIPTCSHGTRTIKQGVSAAGKPWQGALCEVRGASKGDRCPAIWYVMSKETGKWRLPEGVE